MPLFPSDFKKFKHVSSDDKTTTLEHPAGHSITIMHSALKGDMRKQLEALSKSNKKETTKEEKMADGGVITDMKRSGLLGTPNQVDQQIADEANKNSNYIPNTGSDVRTPEQLEKAKQFQQTGMLPEWHPKAQQPQMAQGGNVQSYAEGDMVVPDYRDPMSATQETESPKAPDVDPELQRTREIYNKIVATPLAAIPGMPVQDFQFGDEGQVPSQFDAENWQKAKIEHAEEKTQNAAQIANAQQQAIQQNQARAEAGLPTIPVPNVPEGPQIPGSIGNPTAATPPEKYLNPSQQPTDALGSNFSDTESMMKQGYENKLAGINAEAVAKGNLGVQQEKALKRSEKAQLDAQTAYKQHYEELDSERKNLIRDIQDGYVDPNKFWTGGKNGEGGHSKIAAGIGMILAGFNPTNSPNAAINFLKFQMEQNLDAQRQNLGAKQNLLSMNMRQFGNLKDATDMTRIMQNDIMQNTLMQAAAHAASPLAKSAAAQAAGQFSMDSGSLFNKFAMQRAMMGLANNGGDPRAVEQMIAYKRAAGDLEGAKEMESRYVPHVGMASIPVPEKVRGEMVMKQQFGNAVEDLTQWARKHSGSMSPSVINEGKAKAANVQNLYRDAINGGVFKPGEQEFIGTIVDSDPTKFFNSVRVIPKLMEASKQNDNSLNILKSNYGLPKGQSTMTPEIKTFNGAKYQKVSGGWQKVK